MGTLYFEGLFNFSFCLQAPKIMWNYQDGVSVF